MTQVGRLLHTAGVARTENSQSNEWTHVTDNCINTAIAIAILASSLNYMNWSTMPNWKLLLTTSAICGFTGVALSNSPGAFEKISNIVQEKKLNIETTIAVGCAVSAFFLGFNAATSYLHPTFGVHSTQLLLTMAISLGASHQIGRFIISKQAAK
jgi:cation transport ATPase